jgi:hypothetical protein
MEYLIWVKLNYVLQVFHIHKKIIYSSTDTILNIKETNNNYKIYVSFAIFLAYMGTLYK